MNKKLLLMILLVLVALTLSSCSLAIEGEPVITDPTQYENEEPRLRGYVLSFRSYEINGIHMDFGLDPSNPFMIYENHSILGNANTTEYIKGNGIFGVLYIENVIDHARSSKIETEIILGNKFLNSIMDIRQVVYDPKTDQLNIIDNTYGHMLSSMNIGLKLGIKSELKENDKIIHSFEFEINVKFVDELISMKVIEYDKNNTLIKETITIDSDDYTLTAQQDTDYVIVEEVYKNIKNEIYVKRAIFSKGENYTDTYYIPLMFTNEIGYVENNQKIKLIFT